MRTVALAGNPNSGKTTLFNQLTGLRQRVGNYPGVTVERRVGRASFAPIDVIDLPGTYSLIAQGRDEAVAFEVIAGHSEAPPDLTVVVIDASNLQRNLYLCLSILELGRPALIALNMMDLAKARGIEIDSGKLSEALGVPVFPIVAKSGESVKELEQALKQLLAKPPPPYPRAWRLSDEEEAVVAELAETLGGTGQEGAAIWALCSAASASTERDDPLAGLPDFAQPIAKAKAQLGAQLVEFPAEVIKARYEVARALTQDCEHKGALKSGPTRTDRIDAWLLHPLFGAVFFVLVMALVFQGLFAWSDPLIGAIEDSVGWLQGVIGGFLPEGILRDFLIDGVVGGVGSVIVFVPQIALLFALLAVMEDSGYLARAAFLSDRLMARIGLHGRAFVPLISGFACAVPAVMATRSIESRRDRLVTILVTPLISCSARLPVYTLLIAALFASDQPVFGVFNVGGVIMVALYALSVAVAILVAFVLKRTLLSGPTPPLVLELPPYRRPELRSVLRRAVDRAWVFIRQAGTVILACSIILWALLYFPRPDIHAQEAERVKVEQRYQAALERAEDTAQIEAAHEEALSRLDDEAAAKQLQDSYAGRIGHLLVPIIRPLGFDWKIGVGLLASFAAREVFVSTMGLIYGVGEADEESASLRERLHAELDPETGRPVYTPLVGLSLMIFFLLAAQCMSTLAAIKRETNSWRWPIFSMLYMNALAWLGSFLVFQGGKLLGF